MDPKPIKTLRPEAQLQLDIIKMLRNYEWYVKPTHGNAYQSGFPDLFCSHTLYGHRWVEVKVTPYYKFTQAQLETFPKLCAHGSGVWILVAATRLEYDKLFKKPNWHVYLDVYK